MTITPEFLAALGVFLTGLAAVIKVMRSRRR